MTDSIEQTKGKRRLGSKRLSAMHEGATPEQVERRREQLRENARNRASKEATRAPLKAVVGEQVRRALGNKATPEESRLVAENALTLARDAAREVAHASPFVAHHTTRFGVNAALRPEPSPAGPGIRGFRALRPPKPRKNRPFRPPHARPPPAVRARPIARLATCPRLNR